MFSFILSPQRAGAKVRTCAWLMEELGGRAISGDSHICFVLLAMFGEVLGPDSETSWSFGASSAHVQPQESSGASFGATCFWEIMMFRPPPGQIF